MPILYRTVRSSVSPDSALARSGETRRRAKRDHRPSPSAHPSRSACRREFHFASGSSAVPTLLHSPGVNLARRVTDKQLLCQLVGSTQGWTYSAPWGIEALDSWREGAEGYENSR